MRRNFNRVLRVVSIILGALFILTPLSFSETEIKVSGQVRVRTEVEKKTFVGLDTLINDWTDMRTRIGMEANLDSSTTAFVQIQDSRRFGENFSAINTEYVCLYQAYINIHHLWKKGPGLKVGRFEIALGNERIFGTVDWSNEGRSWEGLTAYLETPFYEINGFWLKKRDFMYSYIDIDNDVLGVYVNITRIATHLFVFYEYNEESIFVYDNEYHKFLGNIYNFGIYNRLSLLNLNFTVNSVFKSGNATTTETEYAISYIENYSAFMFALDAEITLNSGNNGKTNVGIDYSSGDKNAHDDKVTYYDNPYYSGHKFRGYMGYFISSSYYGLVDLYLKGKIDPIRGWTTACDIHYFTAAVDYTDYRGERTKDIGAEIDFTVSTGRISGVGLQAGGSIFFPTEAYAERVSPRPGLWGYTMLTADF